jgi:UPF0042 nucleotide-binding protein
VRTPEPGTRFLIVTGQSGAGRTVVADHLEDLGWLVVRNLPAALVDGLLDVTGDTRVALVAGPGQQDHVRPLAVRLREAGVTACVLFLAASPETLVRRYNETRRVHPCSTGTADTSLLPAIEQEADRLRPVRAAADIVLDSSGLSKHELRRRVAVMFDDTASSGMQLTVQSFGFKHGLPLDADLVLDCRFLPNPHWVEELRPGTGHDAPVRDYVLGQPAAAGFLQDLENMLVRLLPAFAAEQKTYLTVGIGCTGGRHRSVAIAEEIGRRLRSHGVAPGVLHRDVGR